MATSASVKVLSKDVMLLEKDGKKLYMKVEGIDDFRWRISSAKSDFTFDSPNPGIFIIGFDADLDLSKKQKIKVIFMPGELQNVQYKSLL
jgi:hypothetical protein